MVDVHDGKGVMGCMAATAALGALAHPLESQTKFAAQTRSKTVL
jgi:hypothetical protein